MTTPAELLSEQLSALMDGELPEAEARFLWRRLEHDAELRAQWARLQLASACLKGQPLRLMSQDLCARIGAETRQAAPAKVQRPLLRWAMAASVAALALVFAPRLIQDQAADSAAATAGVAASTPQSLNPSPASADLVAMESAPGAAVNPARIAAAATPSSTRDLIDVAPEASPRESPMPLSAQLQSPTEFPLADSGDKRNWPRSELIGGAGGPAIEAYLVRHNQMLANDGLGGFVPYVDVVTSDQPATAPEQDTGASQQ